MDAANGASSVISDASRGSTYSTMLMYQQHQRLRDELERLQDQVRTMEKEREASHREGDSVRRLRERLATVEDRFEALQESRIRTKEVRWSAGIMKAGFGNSVAHRRIRRALVQEKKRLRHKYRKLRENSVSHSLDGHHVPRSHGNDALDWVVRGSELGMKACLLLQMIGWIYWWWTYEEFYCRTSWGDLFALSNGTVPAADAIVTLWNPGLALTLLFPVWLLSRWLQGSLSRIAGVLFLLLTIPTSWVYLPAGGGNATLVPWQTCMDSVPSLVAVSILTIDMTYSTGEEERLGVFPAWVLRSTAACWILLSFLAFLTAVLAQTGALGESSSPFHCWNGCRFLEATYLLERDAVDDCGQPAEDSSLLTLVTHLAFGRDWILRMWVPVFAIVIGFFWQAMRSPRFVRLCTTPAEVLSEAARLKALHTTARRAFILVTAICLAAVLLVVLPLFVKGAAEGDLHRQWTPRQLTDPLSSPILWLAAQGVSVFAFHMAGIS